MGVATESISQLGLGFFGLTSETAPIYRVNLFTQIHEIVFHGKGGYDWDTIYNMPRWLRQFTFNKINEFYTKEAEAAEAAANDKPGSITLIDSSGNINKESWKGLMDQSSPSSNQGKKVKYS